MTQSDRYANFLSALARSGIRLTPFEAGWVDSNLTSFNFSPRQERVVHRLLLKYGSRVEWTGKDALRPFFESGDS